MKMIVGLGNPGSKYHETKHNIGFMVVDYIAQEQQVQFKRDKTFEAEIGEFFLNGEKVILVKPLTFMNESGRAVGPLATYYGVAMDEILVVYDDLDLATGKLRLRETGGAGGHNGIKSLVSHLREKNFKRIRIGIGRPSGQKTVIDHVLSRFSKEEQTLVNCAVADAADAALAWVKSGDFSAVMNQFNIRK